MGLVKYVSTFLILSLPVLSYGQTVLAPGDPAVEQKWIRAQEQRLAWYMLKDTARITIGHIDNQILKQNGKLILVTRVQLKNAPAPWIDTSVAELPTLRPLYHASYNAQRDMVLYFGASVTGSYRDKTKPDTVTINDPAPAGCFDSNLYPRLLAWLPLKEGYRQSLQVYDYNPSASGPTAVRIENVKSGVYPSVRAGLRKVWIVTVSDKIGGSDNTSVYYFDQVDRKLWQQEIIAGGRRMLMAAVE
ncbi:DUF3108 domain-containing protein [Taibaiella helva]|uniref:DUF3108 domain-containing protein n=1 Tax=Taibaiella helva TaxID=2301235 RepID=UPI000E597A85|nr:hypothetical protein [Taibaiella helva]